MDLVLFAVLSRYQQSSDALAEALNTYRATPADPGVLGMVTNWDGQWYQSIATEGYPGSLPVDADGNVQQNSWAFFPAYPMLVRSLMTVTGLPFSVAAVTISIVASTVAMCWLYTMVQQHAGPWLAGALVLGINCFPTAPVFAAAYSEGLALLVIVAALSALQKHRYGAFALMMLLLGVTRPISIAFAPVLALHALRRRRAEGRLSPRDAKHLTVALCSTVVAFGIWPGIAGLLTGRINAYLLTQEAWLGSGWNSWAVAATRDLGLGYVVAVAVALAAYFVLRPDARLWPSELRTWAASYAAFLVVTVRPVPSITRYTMLAIVFCWPLAELGLRSSRVARIVLVATVVAVGIVVQYEWLRGWWVYSETRRGFP
ncbi:hypothetical protein JK386_15860 [Nocardioides sp. zg-536]|uniref:DUF2029 domain-containing protein n=1 Tax=Nocardioides faecalis TaxID=2803858 RepID=A0A938YB27_9ACTN|nr:hypothetical protein [Nocardioides faecalis]MBM9461378.1 hypothetical protein [Nocardioides faecalis]